MHKGPCQMSIGNSKHVITLNPFQLLSTIIRLIINHACISSITWITGYEIRHVRAYQLKVYVILGVNQYKLPSLVI